MTNMGKSMNKVKDLVLLRDFRILSRYQSVDKISTLKLSKRLNMQNFFH
jgi:hypothetical protein